MGTSSDVTWCANTSSEGSVNGKSWISFFLFFSPIRLCRHNPVAPATTVAAIRRRYDEQCGSGGVGSSTPPHNSQLPDSDTTSSTAGSETGCSTPPQDMQPPNVDMTSSALATWAAAAQCGTTQLPNSDATSSVAAAARWAAAHRCKTRNHPMLT